MLNFLWTVVSIFLGGCLIFAVGAFIVMVEILQYQENKHENRETEEVNA